MKTLEKPLLQDEAPAEPPRGTARRLLISHVLTKFGSKAWEVCRISAPTQRTLEAHIPAAPHVQFSTPLLLLEFSPGDLGAPTAFGLSVFLFKVCLRRPLLPLTMPLSRAVLSLSSAPGSSSLGPCAVAGWTAPTGWS